MEQQFAIGGDTRRPELDGIRGAACLLILIWHYVAGILNPQLIPAFLHPWLQLSWTGVDLFFVLSGFLVGGILLDHRDAENYFSVFYLRRISRIFPLYYCWFGLFLLLPLCGVANPIFSETKVPAWTNALFLQNIPMAWQNSFGSNPRWMGMTWSLAVEEQFYLLLPLFIRCVPRRRQPVVLVLLVLAAPLTRLCIAVLKPGCLLGTYVLLPCRMDSLLLGVLAAHLVRHKQASEWARDNLGGLYVLFAILLAGFTLIGCLLTDSISSPVIVQFGYLWIAALYAVVLLLTIYSPFFQRFFRSRGLVFMGSISFGVYVFQQGVATLVGQFVSRHPVTTPGGAGLLTVLAATVVTLLLATASYRFLEVPFIRLGRKTKYRCADALPEPISAQNAA